MTCIHGNSPMPEARDFADAEELRLFLGLPKTAQGLAILANVTPEERQTYAEMRAVVEEIQAGCIPKGVIACTRTGKGIR